MLKKLRARFVCVNMAIVLVILATLFGTVLHATRSSLERECDETLARIAENPVQFHWRQDSGTSPLPYFTVEIGLRGDIRVVSQGYLDAYDTETLSGILSAVAQRGESAGELKDYQLRYRITRDFLTDYVVFVDTSTIAITMEHLVKISLVIGFCALALFFVVSIFLARWAVRPVDAAWKQQTQFVSDASHELKTPLTVILTNAELLQAETEDSGRSHQLAENILTMSRQMRGLVEGLLELARVDNGSVQKTFGELDWSHLAEEAELPFEPLFYEKGLELACDIVPGIRCRGSEHHLRQVIEILLDNAQKYSAPGTVKLSLRPQGRGHAILTVDSPGEPLSPEECRNIFKRFYRADKVRSMDHSYGLGLSIADTIVRDHKGRIWCEPHPGGNTFSVLLPVIS